VRTLEPDAEAVEACDQRGRRPAPLLRLLDSCAL